MFNKNKKRIEELEKQVAELFATKVPVKADAITKNLHLKSDMVCIKGEKEIEFCIWGQVFTEKEPKDFYFLKGTEPKCDFIKEDIKGNLSYYKNNVECDMGGKVKK